MSEPTPAPLLSADELEARIEQRRREMDAQPCYRCEHSNNQPDPVCVCCLHAHTPNINGDFAAKE